MTSETAGVRPQKVTVKNKDKSDLQTNALFFSKILKENFLHHSVM